MSKAMIVVGVFLLIIGAMSLSGHLVSGQVNPVEEAAAPLLGLMFVIYGVWLKGVLKDYQDTQKN